MQLGRRSTKWLTGVFFLLLALPVLADSDLDAQKKLGDKLVRLSQTLDMKETSFPDSAGNGGKSFNSNDGNSFLSTTTYHSNVYSTCQSWVGGRYCDRWLDPYVSPHGFGADQSPLEGAIGREWKKVASATGGAGGQFKIWKVDTKDGGSVLDVDGKLNTEVLSRWELLDDVKKKAVEVGEKTAINQISLSYDDDAPKGESVLPNMESLRMMAQRWTKMYRNRMLSNLGELRAMSKGVEFALNEDVPDCQAYVQALKKGDIDDTRIEERRYRQPLLDPETKGRSLDSRLQACRRLRSASAKMVNAQYQGGKVVEGSLEAEAYDKVAARMAIDTVDQAGVNIKSLERPSWFNLSEDQVSNELVDFEAGGLKKKKVRMTNAEQILSYNDDIEKAAVGMTEVAARTGGTLADTSDRIRSYKIKPGSRNMVDLNGMTEEMYGEVRPSSFPIKSQTAKNNPAQKLEDKPHQLTITRSP